ncbi:MAG: ATP-dependent DNA helicase RecG [Bacillota bacterium]
MGDFDLWGTDVQYIKGVGPGRARLLKKMGIGSIGDLLFYFPRGYDDRSRLKSAGMCVQGETATIRGVVTGVGEKRPRRGLVITSLFIQSQLESVEAVWYNNPFIRKNIAVGTAITVSGKINIFGGRVQVRVEDYDTEERGGQINTGRVVPIYPLTEGISQRQMRAVISSALEQWLGRLTEYIPTEILDRHGLPGIGPALCAVHFPDSVEEIDAARRRFIFEEFFLQQVLAAGIRAKNKKRRKKHSYPAENPLEGTFLSMLPYKMTPGQESAWREISTDMNKPYPMNRLLQGDVGSGKTLVLALALIRCAAGGNQAALMAPTEILAAQHFKNLENYFAGLGISVGLLTGSVGKRARRDVLKKIGSGDMQVVIGTHALIQDDIEFRRLTLVVIDEQHRFGVRQRALLGARGDNPDVLVVTATPIPRTLAMTVYGDLDVSVIKGMPPGRKPVKTYVCRKSRADRVYRGIRREVSEGRQAYIVCPLVEESEKMDLQAASDLRDYLAEGPFKGLSVGILHGRMSAVEKEGTMAGFREGHINVLVSTTVIEVGVDVPNATIMVVVDAERFGLAQLHQLRGRVGRGEHDSMCILIYGSESREATRRMEAMRTIDDGFLLAEKDLEIRGPGELYGTRQWGEFTYKIADPVKDRGVLEEAALEAGRLVVKDPGLKSAENIHLADEIRSRFGERAGRGPVISLNGLFW